MKNLLSLSFVFLTLTVSDGFAPPPDIFSAGIGTPAVGREDVVRAWGLVAKYPRP